jgi:hypothetical protein
VSFPDELEEIGEYCFLDCASLVEVDLSNTCLEEVEEASFWKSGVIRLSLPATLKWFCNSALVATPLKMLDLTMCAGLTAADTYYRLEVKELLLPRRHFAELTRELLPGSRVEVLYADICIDEAKRLVRKLDTWGIDRLRIVSRRLGAPLEWRGVARPRLESVTNPGELIAPSAVFITAWRTFGHGELGFLRSIDMSTLPLAEFPDGATLSNCSRLESAILPTGLKVLPVCFFRSCWRLSHVDTSGCTVLEVIGGSACEGCRSLNMFDFPRTIREVRWGRSAGRRSRRSTCRRR